MPNPKEAEFQRKASSGQPTPAQAASGDAVTLRSAKPSDAPRLAQLSSDTYRSTYAGMFSKDSWLDFATPEYFRPHWDADVSTRGLKDEGPVVVAEVDGEVVGFLAVRWAGDRGDAYAELPSDAFHELKELYVHREHQRSKHRIGLRLLAHVLKDLADDKRVVGHAARRNTGIRTYMKALGAEEAESGTIVLFKHTSEGKPWEVKTGRVSFYWRVPALREALKTKLDKHAVGSDSGVVPKDPAK